MASMPTDVALLLDSKALLMVLSGHSSLSAVLKDNFIGCWSASCEHPAGFVALSRSMLRGISDRWRRRANAGDGQVLLPSAFQSRSRAHGRPRRPLGSLRPEQLRQRVNGAQARQADRLCARPCIGKATLFKMSSCGRGCTTTIANSCVEQVYPVIQRVLIVYGGSNSKRNSV